MTNQVIRTKLAHASNGSHRVYMTGYGKTYSVAYNHGKDAITNHILAAVELATRHGHRHCAISSGVFNTLPGADKLVINKEVWHIVSVTDHITTV